jgi:EmrB/QacA subfamily drug resistance transporter
VAAPAVGPVLGGYLVEFVDWRLVYFINLPIGAITAVLTVIFIPRVPGTVVHRFDLAGFTTIAIGMAALLLAASKGEHWGWEGYRIRALFVVAALFLALFVVVELQVRHPLLEVRLLAIRQFSYTVVGTGLGFINLLVGVFYVPVFLQQVQGLGAFHAGLLMLPAAVATCFAMTMAGTLYERMGPRLIGVTGCFAIAAGDLLFADLNVRTNHTEIMMWTTIRGLGIGFGLIPLLTWGVTRVPATSTNHASAIQNVAQQVGGALGLAALGTLITALSAQLFADRASLLQADSALGQLAGPVLGGAGPLDAESFAPAYRLGTVFADNVIATTFGNVFLLVGLVSLAFVPVPLLLRERKPVPTAVPGDTAAVPADRQRVLALLRQTRPRQQRVLALLRQTRPRQQRVLEAWRRTMPHQRRAGVPSDRPRAVAPDRPEAVASGGRHRR